MFITVIRLKIKLMCIAKQNCTRHNEEKLSMRVHSPLHTVLHVSGHFARLAHYMRKNDCQSEKGA